jgi:actin-related protein
MGAMFGVLSTLVYATILFIRNSRKATPEEIEALLPVLKLSPVQKAYCLAVVTVYRSNLISDIDRDQIRTAHTALMEQAHKLELQVEKTNGLATGSDAIQLQQEINDINARIAETLDAEAVKTLEETRVLVQKRLSRVTNQGNGAGRAEAQIELMRQSFLSFAEEFDTTFQTTSVAPAMTTDLRKLLHRIQDQTDAVTKAVQEIQQL